MSPDVLQPYVYCTKPGFSSSTLRHQQPPHPTTTGENSSREKETMGKKCSVNFAVIWLVTYQMKGSFTCRKAATGDRELYFPSEGRHAENFFTLKNPTARVPRVSMLTPRPEKPLRYSCTLSLTSALDGVGGQRYAPAV
jgi:hypothetical protein